MLPSPKGQTAAVNAITLIIGRRDGVVAGTTRGKGNAMRSLRIGDVTITSIIERDGPWRRPADMFPAYDPDVGLRHLAAMDPEVYDAASDRMVITYQTFVVRTPHHTILVDTCTGEDKGYPAPMDFPKQPWLDGFRAEGLTFEDIDYVFCTHLHIEIHLPQEGIRCLGGSDAARRSAAGRCVAVQLRADRRGRPGAAGR
jgi:Metallo-beta-lactamase superfamily